MNRYFFIPGNRLHKFDEMSSLNIDRIIIDLEDAVKVSNRSSILKDLVKTDKFKKEYIRVPLHDENDAIDVVILKELLNSGYSKFVFPKLNDRNQLVEVLEKVDFPEITAILLIETPKLLLEISEALESSKDIIKSIAIGSHDLMSLVGGEHTLGNLYYPRTQLLYAARAYGVEAIDIASMELKDENEFVNEIKDGISMGFESKFFIHPWQIERANTIEYYSREMYLWASRIVKALKEVQNEAEFKPIIIEGEIIERPHLDRAKKIVKYFNI